MTKLTNREKIVDLTSLLDVVLILLFGLLVTMSMEKQEAQNEIQVLEDSLYQEQRQLDYLINKQEMINAQIAQIIESDDPAKRLEQLDFVAQQFLVIDVWIDKEKNHEIIMNDESTHIFLPLSIRNNPSALEQARQDIYTFIETMIADNQEQSKYVLLSLEDKGGTYNYAFNLVWNVFREIEQNEQSVQVHKMQYIHY
ncbi:hypothetical protein QBE53_09710 [Vallitaleaceae bacterium 9-2]